MNKDYKPINNLWKDSKGYRYFGTLKLSSKIKYDGDDFIPLWEWINQLQQENKKQKEVIDRILNETKETRHILNNDRDDNMLSKRCLLSYLEIVENLLKKVSE